MDSQASSYCFVGTDVADHATSNLEGLLAPSSRSHGRRSASEWHTTHSVDDQSVQHLSHGVRGRTPL
jgi:hypothetical protein